MDYYMGGHHNLCGTCDYWVGPRQPDFYGSGAVLPDQCTGGKCFCLNSPLARMDRFSNSCACGDYKKWAVLK